MKMAKSASLATLKVLMILIFIFWISLWMIKPTSLWTKAWRRAEDGTSHTLFGYYGLNFVILTFPVIALAILGLIYSNSRPKQPLSRSETFCAVLSKPVIINAFIGIISFFEILMVLLFMLFLVWTFYARISKDFSKLTPVKSLKLNLWQLKYLRVATRFGLLAEACLALLLLPLLRGLSLFRMIGIQFEASVRYHIWLGTAMIFFATFHGASTLIIWGTSHYINEEVWKWQRTGRIFLAGEVALVIGLVMFVTSLPQIRRKSFEVFYYTHHLYVMFLLFFLFHAGDRHFYWVFPGILLFSIDKLLRIVQSRLETSVVEARILMLKAVELVLPKDPRLAYLPSSILFMNVPSISRLQWHPFSISSSSIVNDQTVSVIIKCEGSWTNSLFNTIQSTLDADKDHKNRMAVRVEGPYGPASSDFLRYASLILVAGGVGVTPFLSILQEISCTRSYKRNQFPLKVQLVSVVKSTQEISMLAPISSLILKPASGKTRLKLKIFVTREKTSSSNVQGLISESLAQIRTVHFKAEDSSNRVKGMEDSRYMAALAGASSFVFFVCLVCFNHVFAPEGTKKSKSMKLAVSSEKKFVKEKTPSSIIDMVIVLCFVISLACSALLNLFLQWMSARKAVPEAKQGEFFGQHSSESIESGDEEHEVHFGKRPDFEAIFSEFRKDTGGGSETGVLVCGPESMKRSVARVCSETKGQRFRFHSLNFDL